MSGLTAFIICQVVFDVIVLVGLWQHESAQENTNASLRIQASINNAQQAINRTQAKGVFGL